MPYLASEDLGKCAICLRTESRKICSRCGERIYCSRACQRKDWEAHKSNCTRTTRIDLASFQFLLAVMFNTNQSSRTRPYHMSLERKILNSPHSQSAPTRLPDGSLAKLVIIGDKISRSDSGTRIWWPSAPNQDAIMRLLRRTLWHGWLMPNYTIMCIAVLLSIFKHPPSNPNKSGLPREKLGLKYHGIPIVDFGIGKGSIKVPPGSRYAYWVAGAEKMGEDGKTRQTPHDHYWMYFTNILGKEFILDCGMCTYGLGLTVHSKLTPKGLFDVVEPVPAYFTDKHVAVIDRKIRTTKERFSVLHEPLLSKLSPITASGVSPTDQRAVLQFMAKVKGQQPIEDEKVVVMKLLPVSANKLGQMLRHRSWDEWPTDGFTGYDNVDDGVQPAPSNYLPVFVHRPFSKNCAQREYLKKWINMKYKPEDIQNLEDVVKNYLLI